MLVTADAQGSFTTPFAVAATITTQFTGGAVDCVVIGACELVAVFATNSGPPAVEAPIEFAGAVPATTTTTTEPNSSSPCTPPYLPQAWGRGPGGPFTETSGTWGPVSGVEGKIWWDGTYPGAVPTPPPGIAVPSPVYGVIEVPSLGVFAMYADTHGSWFVIVLMNSDQVLSLAKTVKILRGGNPVPRGGKHIRGVSRGRTHRQQPEPLLPVAAGRALRGGRRRAGGRCRSDPGLHRVNVDPPAASATVPRPT